VLMGPWLHGPLSGLVGDVDFGYQADDATVMSAEWQLRWFDRWLKAKSNGIDEEPPIRLFVMGDNVWRDEETWPPAGTRPTECFLHSGGAANTLYGDGALSFEGPVDEAIDTFVYDPRNPVPTLGGGLCCSNTGMAAGAYDQREIEARPDVLVYTSGVLQEDLEVTGPVVAKLWAATSARDTDFTAKLVDVGPCGYARNVADGVIRARYRVSTAETRLVEPDKAYEYSIELGPTSNVFKAGHRVRLEVSSSNFPKIARNPNTGADIGVTSDLRPAVQTILHNADHPSCVILPIVPR
ncbi:MAG: CocE/NonD family hydrolase, partial [Anaerolineae bacterium]|nr:CocE/NonD family hydrolase [Anaerolineae bacterium]